MSRLVQVMTWPRTQYGEKRLGLPALAPPAAFSYLTCMGVLKPTGMFPSRFSTSCCEVYDQLEPPKSPQI
eukprot:458527-Amphidinium_carterae.1